MNITKILTVVFYLVSIGLAYFLVTSIANDIEQEKVIKAVEAKVINKLMQIRDAEIAYQAANGAFTSDWNKLISFVDTGAIYITERKETIIRLDYGADSIYVEIDTLGSVPVKDSLFSSDFEPSSLPNVPDSDKQFKIWADKINKSGVMIDVIEVVDPDPVDPTRLEDNEIKNRKPLRFGSRTDVTTAGNWE
ncbi:MAG: hypothetical protein DHS20C17_04420 [Cyclobacteriaceae bacterium]|nr:MAG: hypothetical protein DHS20C17_04420 [Cyclobacteriaceae bacterium]